MLPMLLQGLLVKLLPASDPPPSRLFCCNGASRMCRGCCCLLTLMLLLCPPCFRAAAVGMSSGLTERGGLSRTPAQQCRSNAGKAQQLRSG